MQKQNKKNKLRKGQEQNVQPGIEWKLNPLPVFWNENYFKSQKLTGKVAVITGGDSGIGRATAVSFAAHGADVAIIFLNENRDANETMEFILEKTNQKCLLVQCDIRKEINCRNAIKKVVKQFGKIDILVNNAGVHVVQESILDISSKQLTDTFAANVFSMFYLCKAALPHMKKGSSIINTTSVTAYRGSSHLIDYSTTKGAIVSFTRSLSASLASKGIRVNAVAPGPVWTPLIPASFDSKHVSVFGSDTPLKRAGEPVEIAPSFLFLACDDSSYMTGQVLHPNGGEIING